ncbi:MAG: heparinase II/III family protein, partial [Bryobacteraceae bacterium]
TVRSILLGYAARYSFYSGCSRTGDNPGIATYTTLDESVWSIPLAWAFSLIADTLPAAEAEEIVSKLFVPAAEHLVHRRYPAVHNFTCWHNSAIATMGRVAGRPDLIHFAVDSDNGQRAQLRDGMLGDGLWFEGSMSYHFYAVWAILMSALVFRHDPATGITSRSAVPKSLLAPVECAYPDGTLPATNDCWYFTGILGECCHGVPPAPDFYEVAFALYGDPIFAATLQRAYGAIGGARDSVYALLLGVEALPQEPPPARPSVNLPDSGLAILRPSAEIDLLLKYGPHGGHHGHPDKLSLTGWAYGWRFSPDLGTPGYGVESLETWYRQTLSHNTVLIDGESQPWAHGTLERFDPQSAVTAVEWDGVKLRRAIHAKPEYFIDVFEVASPTARGIDWIYHNAGVLTTEAAAQPVDSIAGGEAYKHLSKAGKLTVNGPIRLQWREGHYGMRMWMPAAAGEQVYTGISPANPPSTSYRFVLRRRNESRTVFVSVLHPYRDDPQVSGVDFLEDGGVSVHLNGRTDQWTTDKLLPGN